jgi:hypothetical protein
LLIALDSGGTDSRAFSSIEHTELNAGLVGVKSHLSPEGIDFFHEMAFPNASHGRIARHLGDFVDINGQHHHIASHPGGCKGGFTTGMAPTNDNNVTFHAHFYYSLFLISKSGYGVYYHLPMQNSRKM